MEQRRSELNAEYQTGQQMLTELEDKHANLRQTLLHISSAIQVVEELRMINLCSQTNFGNF